MEFRKFDLGGIVNYTYEEKLVMALALPEGGYVPPSYETSIAERLITAGKLRDAGDGRVEATAAGAQAYYADLDAQWSHRYTAWERNHAWREAVVRLWRMMMMTS